MGTRQGHWDTVYGSKPLTGVSWYEPRPQKSLALIRGTGVGFDDPIIDVGGGGSFLVDVLAAAGYRDVTVLEKVRDRLGPRASGVTFVHEDVTNFRPARRYAIWHDRAVFHFLVQQEERQRYIDALRDGVLPDGHVVIATFGPSGPERCSGLPTMRYDQAELGAVLGPQFELVESGLSLHQTPWQTPQEFLYCRFDRRG